MRKLYKVQKQYKYNNSIKTKPRFLRGDDVIVISGDYKGCISKIKRRYNNNYYLLEKTKELNQNLENKIKKFNKINEINIKVHDSNIMHYDIVSNSKSKVKYFYLKSDNKKIRIRVYKTSGTEKKLYNSIKQDANSNTNKEESNTIITSETKVDKENNLKTNKEDINSNNTTDSNKLDTK